MHRLLTRTEERILGSSSGKLVALVSETIEHSLPQDYHWPGNVRELEQCTRRILLKRGYEGDMGGREAEEAEQLAEAIQYGFYRLVISRVVRKYLECGDLHQGFTRIKCPDCHHEFILAFSCRGRWFCPSCHNKKVVQFGHHLKETILYPVPHRQYVFSIPKILRRFFLYDRKVLGKLSQCAAKSLTKFLKTILGKKHGIPGLVVSIQTFGDYARWHPHLHVLVADGLFLESGYFFVMPKVDLRPLRELFRGHLLKMLKKEGLIDDAFIIMIMKWRHTSGFNVHNQVRIKPDDEKGIENLYQYIIRNTFS